MKGNVNHAVERTASPPVALVGEVGRLGRLARGRSLLALGAAPCRPSE